jgi:hypothetical protein
MIKVTGDEYESHGDSSSRQDEALHNMLTEDVQGNVHRIV